jgi:Fe-S-cluster containining protein
VPDSEPASSTEAPITERVLSGHSGDPQVEKQLTTLEEYARDFSYSSLVRERTPQKASTIVRKLELYLDGNIEQFHKDREAAGKKGVDCKPGCTHCCYQPIAVTPLEMAPISDYVQKEFATERLLALKENLAAYEAGMQPYRNQRFRRARVACPFLTDGLCSIYAVRPFGCRGLNSMEVETCIRIKDEPDSKHKRASLEQQSLAADRISLGARMGAHGAMLDREPLELGVAAKVLVETPDAVARFFEGEPVFSSAKYQRGSDPVEALAYAAVGTPFRFDARTEAIGDIPKQLVPQFLRQNPFIAAKYQIPLAYTNEEQMLQARQFFLANLQRFAASSYDPTSTFDGLSLYDTFALAYHNLNDRDLMQTHGRFLVEGIAARCFPDLVQPIDKRQRRGKLRLGYISENMYFHNGARWAHGWLKNHADDIETYALNLWPEEDEASREFAAAADFYFHLTGPVGECARFVKSLDLDALIFTDIGMSGRNYQYASMRLAPVQCTAWGHPVTSGLPTIDYYISSDLMEPQNGQDHYTEELVRLPGTGLCYPRIGTPLSQASRDELGLPAGPLFLVAQNIMKCHPGYDHLFAQINERSGAPIVFIGTKWPEVNAIVRKRFEQAGVKAHWLERVPRKDFLRLIDLCDVSLDPPAWSGGNTTIEALYLGKPVVTLPGEFMRARHSLAFLEVAGAPGLIARDEADYVELACDFERQRRAMSSANPEALFEDTECVAALDEFLRRVTQP